MSIQSTTPDLLSADVPAAPSDREPQAHARLWPSLTRPPTRPQPLQGPDRFGEYVRGVAARFRHARLPYRSRAERIVEAAAGLQHASEATIDDRLDIIRADAVTARDDPDAIDTAFSLIYEVIRRTLGLSLHVEQVMGGLAMVNGCCAELATGEGKTVTAILPAALDGWSGRGVHVITVNDYLAKRDATTTSPAYQRLGLSVGVITDESKARQRLRAYAQSITYAADKQVIFDHLRDRLHAPVRPRLTTLLLDGLTNESVAEGQGTPGWPRRVVHRGLHAAIIDEADSVLIDEATTPAIISGERLSAPSQQNTEAYQAAARIAEEFAPGQDYTIDLRIRRIRLTDRGRRKADEMADQLPAFWSGPRRREELITQALTARDLHRKGDEYIVRDGKVVIVDPSTGRVLEGRQWQLGLHQAVEAKEGLEISDDRRTSARVSYQRFFKKYERLSGMTGTAAEVAHELWRDYTLPVVRVPTHKPVIRTTGANRVYLSEEDKFRAVADRVAALHAERRPVLIGTRSVAASETLGRLLEERRVPCRILNANREAEEAAIIAEAGRPGAVTVATNMAGRGTDIKLDEASRKLGGLVVIATERHDESRVDRQLYGRAGRQGDPGHAEAFVCLEDMLIQRHGLAPLKALCRRTHGPVRKLVARVLWTTAQRGAGRSAAMVRSEVAKSDAWTDLALHHETR